MLMKKNTQLILSRLCLALVAALLLGAPLPSLATCSSTPSLLNGSFEGGNTSGVGASWTSYASASTLTYAIQTATPSPDGGNWQQVVLSTASSSGGVAQNITGLTVGSTYQITGYFKSAHTRETERVKISNPAVTISGANYNSSAVDFSTPVVFVATASWTFFSANVVAAGTSMTLWLWVGTGTQVNDSGNFDGIVVTCLSDANLQWTAAGSSTWNTTDLNWLNGGTAVAYTEGNPVVFEDSFSPAGPALTVTLSSTVNPASVTANNSIKTYTISGTGLIGNTYTAGLTKNGSGTLTLSGSGANTFAGGINANGGTLTLDYANQASLVASANTLGLGGGTLKIKGKNSGATAQTLGNVTVNAGGGQILIDPFGGSGTTLTLGTSPLLPLAGAC